MLLYYIEDFLESEETSWNEYTIFRALIRAWLYREQRKILDEKQQFPDILDLWKACWHIALHLQLTGKRKISEADLIELIRTFPEIKHVPFMHLGGRSLLNKDSEGSYRFSHFSIQEFLVVNAILEGNVDVDVPSLRATDFMNTNAAAWLKNARPEERFRLPLRMFDFSGLDFSETDFCGMDFSEAKLEKANFTNANLEKANFENALMNGATLKNARLRHALFRSAALDKANLERADAYQAVFAWAKLNKANVQGTIFTKANLNWAELKSAVFNNDTSWPLLLDPFKEGAQQADKG